MQSTWTFSQQMALNTVGPAVTVLLAAIAGQRLSAYWAVRQKRRELALSAANEFYRLYGEFFAVWKLWSYAAKSATRAEELEPTRWALLQRATTAEAGVEALLVKLAAERPMTRCDLEIAGRFRQAYQMLRQVIKNRQPLDWYAGEHPQYHAYKALACNVAHLIATSDRSKLPTSSDARSSLLEITSNKWENRWWAISE